MSFDKRDWMVVGGTALVVLAAYAYGLRVPDAPAPEVQAPAPRTTYSKEQRVKGEAIMEAVRSQARVYEEGGNLVVECRQYIHPTDINARLGWVRSVCDADATITGGPRSIFFYDPSMKKFAQADRLNGIRLID